MGNRVQWMTSLPNLLHSVPIINLAIPGSHDSMTYGIKSGAEPAPDAENPTKWLNFCFPWFVRRWAKTQSASVLEQLRLGIRYFDLRLCQKNNKFFFAHGLFAMEIFEPLTELKQYLLSNKGEVCILDFQHFYDMNVSHHMKLHSDLLQLFGPLLYSKYDGTLNEFTLNRCRALGRQILLIYRRCSLFLPNEFWSSNNWQTPWPNLTSVRKLQLYLQNSLLSRNPTQGFVSQCILTPTRMYITLRIFSSLHSTAKKVDRKITPWMEDQTPGPFQDNQPPKANVFIADFVNEQFCDLVIELNFKIEVFLNIGGDA
ncbi:PI-PLC X domain-containing protein 2-like [Eurosta solidaginis]|uniref:PI-PLC X domain-containing protein 2-like n=1 Tax=Eurosta solidaginis TaxID=178769 RepID=UPI003530CC6B